MKTITELANFYKSDKGTEIPSDRNNHGPRLHFTKIYDIHMTKFKNKEIKILEIGIGSGPSLKIWYDYFENAKIYAIDVDNHKDKNNDRITTFICNQSNRDELEDLMKIIGEVDLIIDDGSHVISHQQISLGILFKYLNKDGQYWIEDLHTSDIEVWNNKNLYGYDMSFNPGESTVDILQNYIDNGYFNSPFLNESENLFLTENIGNIELFNLPRTHWGENKLCLITNKI